MRLGGPPAAGEDQAGREIAGAQQAEHLQPTKEAVGIDPLADAGRSRGSLAASAEHHHGLGSGSEGCLIEGGRRRAPLVGALQPAPETLRGKGSGKDPKQGEGRNHRPPPATEGRPEEEQQDQPHGQHQQGQDLAQQKHDSYLQGDLRNNIGNRPRHNQ